MKTAVSVATLLANRQADSSPSAQVGANLRIFLVDVGQVGLSDFDGGCLAAFQKLLDLAYGQRGEVHLK